MREIQGEAKTVRELLRNGMSFTGCSRSEFGTPIPC